MDFEKVSGATIRAAAIVGDTLADAIGKPENAGGPVVFNVTRQPATSDVFSGASNVPYVTAIAATFALPGRYVFLATAGDVDRRSVEVVVWPAAAMNVPQIRYKHPSSTTYENSCPHRRSILRALAGHATVAGIQATLEGGAAIAPFYGVQTAPLGVSQSLAAFGAW
jgi:hypothetical protein